MKFNKRLRPEIRKFLESQYNEYIKRTPMTKKERLAVRQWVESGHSVYENPYNIWAEWRVPVEFLTVYREKETSGKTVWDNPSEPVLCGWDEEIADGPYYSIGGFEADMNCADDDDLPF